MNLGTLYLSREDATEADDNQDLKIQATASSMTPQTQNRGRRRVCLGLLGAFMPPAAVALRLSGSEHAACAAPPLALLNPPVPPLGSIHDPGQRVMASARPQHRSATQQRRGSRVHELRPGRHTMRSPAGSDIKTSLIQSAILPSCPT
ncbi:hypothetical protein EYF80_007792 [Liparis tanakae]|uniref:Uncharacterized protein n=1 Tax=Liparis tanakae TaxID=230148 RepID=A0A4Z2IWE9_9TELE|nr:hypothetical protein EYF80_007792 [Liparis tanakae]